MFRFCFFLFLNSVLFFLPSFSFAQNAAIGAPADSLNTADPSVAVDSEGKEDSDSLPSVMPISEFTSNTKDSESNGLAPNADKENDQSLDTAQKEVSINSDESESSSLKPTEKPEKKKTKKKTKKKEKVIIKARIHTLWEMQHRDTPDDPFTDNVNEFKKEDIENDFSIKRARFKLIWSPEKWLTAVLHLGDFNKQDFGATLLRDAYIHVSPSQYFEIRVGQFKKSFSRLQLRSFGKLELISRGEGNKLIVDRLRYGDRDLGAQLSGRLINSVKLDYELGVFNGNGPDITERGNSKDIVARISLEPVKWLDLGTNASFKFFHETENQDKFAWATGGDAVFKVLGFRAHLEGLFGIDHDFRTRNPVLVDNAPLVFSVIGIFSYKHEIVEGNKMSISLEPVFGIEMLEPNTKVMNDEVMVYSSGFNSYFGKYLRLMIHGEFRRPLINSSTRFPKQEVLSVQLCFDI